MIGVQFRAGSSSEAFSQELLAGRHEALNLQFRVFVRFVEKLFHVHFLSQGPGAL
jgi:hypothetical protein